MESRLPTMHYFTDIFKTQRLDISFNVCFLKEGRTIMTFSYTQLSFERYKGKLLLRF